MVESFVLLSALGGECINDMQCMRQDKGLSVMLDYTPKAPETAQQWLYRFHDDRQKGKKAATGVASPVVVSELFRCRSSTNYLRFLRIRSFTTPLGIRI